MSKPAEEKFDEKVYYISNHFLYDLDLLTKEIAQKGNFQNWLNEQLGNIDLNDSRQYNWFKERMQELIRWDDRILIQVEKAIADINVITELLSRLSKFYKYWPFSVAVYSTANIISASRFKVDLSGVQKFFMDQRDTDIHVLEKVEKGHHVRARLWFKTSVRHHGSTYSFTPSAIHVATPRFEFKLNILKAIAQKRVDQLKRILAKEDKYYQAHREYKAMKAPVPA
jgi:hypothetical protein